QIAEPVNREGFSPPKRTERFTGETVARVLSRRGLHNPRPRAMANVSVLRPHESWLADLAREGPMPIATFHTWQRLGWVHSRMVPVASGRWAIGADANELERLRQLRAYQRTWPEPRSPQALTPPQRRDRQPQSREVCHDIENKERSNEYGSRLQRSPPWRTRTNNAANEPSTDTWQATPSRTSARHWPARKAGSTNGGSAPWHQIP